MRSRQVFPNRENCTAEELETTIKSARLQSTATRLLAIKALFQGIEFSAVCSLFSISDTSLYNWIHRFNSRGLDGLIPRHSPGRPRKISKEDFSSRLDVIEKPQAAGQTHWTAKKFHGYLKSELQEEVSYTTITRYLKQENYVLKVPRSWPEEHDEELRKAFISKLERLSADPAVELWFLDEAGFDGDPRPRRRWAKRGSSLRVPYSGKHLRMSVTGMVCPDSGEFLALEFNYSDRVAFQTFLDYANDQAPTTDKKQIIVLDNASWHKVKSINWGRFEPLFLPPYSPDLNPIERLWLFIKSQFFTSFIARDVDHLIQQIDHALLALFREPKIVASVCSS